VSHTNTKRRDFKLSAREQHLLVFHFHVLTVASFALVALLYKEFNVNAQVYVHFGVLQISWSMLFEEKYRIGNKKNLFVLF
jgi:hypothetical protein